MAREDLVVLQNFHSRSFLFDHCDSSKGQHCIVRIKPHEGTHSLVITGVSPFNRI